MNRNKVQAAITKISEQDKVMGNLFRNISPFEYRSSELCFENTAKIIVNQQLSGKAAQTIFKRVHNLVGVFCPTNVIAASDDAFRLCGLSYAKIKYIKMLAVKCIDDPGYLDRFRNMTNDVAYTTMIENKGFGAWSVQIFLLFHLQREDIFPLGDATLNAAVSALYSVDKFDQRSICDIAENWSPYRSICSIALWQWVDMGKPINSDG